MTATKRPACRPAPARRTPSLAVLTLEARDCPALLFAFDYSLDRTGFFSNPEARATLERAAADLGAPITSSPAAIAPGGGNTWTAVFDDPSNPGGQVRRDNLSVPAGTQLIFAAGTTAGGGEAGLGGYGGFSVTGTRSWQQTVKNRGQGGFATWGGSLSIDARQDWYFGADPAARPAGQLDFYSVAIHELTHTLGYGTAPAFDQLVVGGAFIGANAVAANGGVAPLVSADEGHLIQGTESDGEPVSMQPTLTPDGRVGTSRLDYAILADLGWSVAGVNASPAAPATPATPVNPIGFNDPGLPGTPVTTSTRPTATVTPPVTALTPLPAGAAVTVVSGADGTAQVYFSENGALAPAGGPVRPFAGFTGAVRSAVADFNADGTQDVALATGPTGGSRIRVFDGKTGADLLPEFSAFEGGFAGGVFLAAGDFDRDGRADLVVTPDQGGGPRVRVLAVTAAGPQSVADFFGIDDANFRGGARAAVGDINADGTPDLVVAAGFGGGPRVALFDGRTVPGAQPKGKLGSDFFAFETTLRNGVYVSAGDVDGDGHADLVFGAGPGGGPRVVVASGRTLLAAGGAAAMARPLADQFVGDPNARGGVRVAAKSLAAGGPAGVVTGSGVGTEVRVLRPAGGGLAADAAFSLPGGRSSDGVYVG